MYIVSVEKATFTMILNQIMVILWQTAAALAKKGMNIQVKVF